MRFLRDTLPGLPLIAGPGLVIATLVLPPPADLDEAAWRASGLAGLMALWWVTEVIPLAATALLPIALWPLISGTNIALPAASYSHPLIFLFLGGVLLARAIESSGLHLRLAQTALRAAGAETHRLLAVIMALTAFLSLWISNTAAAMVMMPIAAAVAGSASTDDRSQAALMLGVAFAATIGGMGSLIGTPPNALFAAYLSEVHGIGIGFAEWAMVGIPVSLTLLIAAWFVLSVFGRSGGARGARRADSAGDAGSLLGDLPPRSVAQTRVAAVAALVALAWITRPVLQAWTGDAGLTDAGIAVAGAVALFVIPSGDGRRLLEWQVAAGIRWDVLILFGGGLALAQIMDQTGLAEWVGDRMQVFGRWPVWAFIMIFAAVIVLLGELASNTSMAAIFLPIAGAAAGALGYDPVSVTLPVALAASVGFMLPVATPPNAIVFSHPAVTRKRMLAAGMPLDLIGVIVAAGLGFAISSALA